MDKRQTVKRILIIIGAVLALAGMALFVLIFIHLSEFKPSRVYTMGIVICAGLIPLSFGLLMHSQDIRETKRGLSSFFKGLSIFWLITGGLNVIAIIVVSILFGGWAWTL